jgi:hypothetical protein
VERDSLPGRFLRWVSRSSGPLIGTREGDDGDERRSAAVPLDPQPTPGHSPRLDGTPERSAELVDVLWDNTPGEFGGAREAARILGMTVSSFNRLRLRVTQIYDPVLGSVSPIDNGVEDLRGYTQEHHLVAPTLAGLKLPGRPWTFRLDLLRRYRDRGWPGAEFPAPWTGPTCRKWGSLSERRSNDE